MTKQELQTGHAGLTFSGKKREKKKPSPDLIKFAQGCAAQGPTL